jgi:hypothetical protein
VNTGPAQGVSLMQADGLNQLRTPGSRNRGDQGDSYPGNSGNTRFGYATNPAARNNFGESAGFLVDQVEQLPAQEIRFRFTRRERSSFRTSLFGVLIRVNGATFPRYDEVIPQGDAVQLAIDAVQMLNADRTRATFVSWSNGGTREQQLSSGAKPDTIVATVSAEHQLAVQTAGDGNVSQNVPGSLPGNFFAAGTAVTLSAAPRTGFFFGGWTGDSVSAEPEMALTMNRPYSLIATFIAEQVIPLQDATDELLGSPRLTEQQRGYLDQLGNRNAGYDVGDYLALLDRTGVTASPESQARIAARPARGGKVR